jgi:predicted nucleotidyltransferase
VELSHGEVRYLRANWPLLSTLKEALRKERSIRLAVLIGSAARGELREDSDVDMIVSTVDLDWRALDAVRARLAAAVGRSIDLVSLAAVEADPLLLSAALREGRPLVDRDRLWAQVVARRDRNAAAAPAAAAELRARVHGLLSELAGGG